MFHEIRRKSQVAFVSYSMRGMLGATRKNKTMDVAHTHKAKEIGNKTITQAASTQRLKKKLKQS